jgi:hypothetical protein
MRGGSRKPGKVKINVTADQVIKCRPGAFIWDMGQIVVELQFEQLTRKVTGSANYADAKVIFGLAFRAAMNSGKVEYGALAGTTSASGTTAASATGIRSLSGS